MLLSNSYQKIERWIIGFCFKIIGLSFYTKLFLVKVDWIQREFSWVKPSIPDGFYVVDNEVLGAVGYAHNLFLHSEIIQSVNEPGDEKIIKKQLV